MRIVLDTNVLISAIIFPGICRSIVASLEENRYTLFLSPALLEDLFRALEKPKLKKLISPDTFEEIISLIHMKATIVEPRIKIKACRDPDDDAVLECAASAKARIIVTGDQDLLTMKKFRNISVLSPRRFASRLKLR